MIDNSVTRLVMVQTRSPIIEILLVQSWTSRTKGPKLLVYHTLGTHTYTDVLLLSNIRVSHEIGYPSLSECKFKVELDISSMT